MIDFESRPLRMPGDDHSLREILARGFPELDGSRELEDRSLEWKFSESARRELSLIAFADDGRPVGFHGFLPASYRIGGEVADAAFAVDVACAPGMRRRGLFSAMGTDALANIDRQGIQVEFAHLIRSAIIPAFVKVGWTASFALPVYARPTGAGSLGLPAPLDLGAGMAGSAWRVLAAPLTARPSGGLSRVEPADFASVPEVSALCSSDHHGVNRLERTPGFWAWRLSRPGADYRCLLAESEGGSAYAVARRSELRGVPALAVLDIDWNADRARRLVLRGLLDLAREEELPLIAMCANPTFARAIGLVRAGFARLPVKFTFMFRLSAAGAPGSASPPSDVGVEADWFTSWIDSDTL